MPRRRSPSHSRNPAAGPVVSTAEIRQAIKSLRDFYRLGSQSLRKYGDRMAYGRMDGEAREARLPPEMLRKARSVADGEHGGWTPGELKELFAMMRQRGAVLGLQHMIRLRTVSDKRQRAKLHARPGGPVEHPCGWMPRSGSVSGSAAAVWGARPGAWRRWTMPATNSSVSARSAWASSGASASLPGVTAPPLRRDLSEFVNLSDFEPGSKGSLLVDGGGRRLRRPSGLRTSARREPPRREPPGRTTGRTTIKPGRPGSPPFCGGQGACASPAHLSFLQGVEHRRPKVQQVVGQRRPEGHREDLGESAHPERQQATMAFQIRVAGFAGGGA